MKKFIIFKDENDYNSYNGTDMLKDLEKFIDENLKKENGKSYMITIEEVEEIVSIY